MKNLILKANSCLHILFTWSVLVSILLVFLAPKHAKAATFAPVKMTSYFGGGLNTQNYNFPYGACSGLVNGDGLTVLFWNLIGQAISAPAGTQMNITGAGSLQFFSDAKCAHPLSNPMAITYGANGAMNPFYFKDAKAESLNLLISSSGVSLAQPLDLWQMSAASLQIQNASLPGWNAYSEAWVPFNSSDTASYDLNNMGCVGGFSIDVLDMNGNEGWTGSGIDINVYSPGIQFFSDARCMNVIPYFTIPAGASVTPTFYMRGNVANASLGLMIMGNDIGFETTYFQEIGDLSFSNLGNNVASFTVSPSTITKGQSATVSWNVPGATAVYLGVGTTPVGVSGSVTVTPSSNDTIHLTAVGPAGTVTDSVQLIVNQPAVSCETGGGCQIGDGTDSLFNSNAPVKILYSCIQPTKTSCSCSGGLTPSCAVSSRTTCGGLSCAVYTGCGKCQ